MGVSELIQTIVIACAGLFVCFGGYKFFRASITLLGLIAGWFTGNIIFDTFADDFGVADDSNAMWIVIGVCMAALGGSAFALYQKAIVGIATLAVAYWFYISYSKVKEPGNVGTSILYAFIGLGLGMIAGLAVLHIQKWAIMLFTSILGARVASTVLAPVFIEIEPVRNGATWIMEHVFSDSSGDLRVGIDDTGVLAGLLLIILSVMGLTIQLINRD